MESKIYAVAFIASDDVNSSIIFQQFGIDKLTHPNLFFYKETGEDDESGIFPDLYKRFNIKELPTVVFTQVIEEDPLRLQPITRIRGAFTYANLEDTFNQIVSEEIPIPAIGNQGTVINSEGEDLGLDGNGGLGLGTKFKAFRWFLVAVVAGVTGRIIYKRRKRRKRKRKDRD